MKKRINWFKIIALILTIIEIYIAFCLDKNLIKANINTWRLYIACIMCIPMNVIFICTKKEAK